MSKLRIHELAKKLQIPNQDLIEKLISKGFFIKTHSNSVDELAAKKSIRYIYYKTK
jgi:phage antirepressor YoqD-like protein